MPGGDKIEAVAFIATVYMPKFNEGDPRDNTFQNGTDQRGRRTPHEDDPPPIPHDQLVGRFRSLIAQKQEQERSRGDDTSPEDIIRAELDWQSGPAHTDHRIRSQAFDFWDPLIKAWDAVAYDRYEPNSLEWIRATNRLSGGYKLTPQGKRVIQINRYQAGILDALAEAAGIPHQKGQTEIPLPQHVMANEAVLGDRQREIWLQMCGGGKPPKR